jgi:hypothetical protein
MIISVRDVIDLADRGKEFWRGIKRSRLEALEAALRKTMPAWKDFDRALEPTTSPDIESRSRRLVGDLEVLVKAFEDNNLDPEQLQTVAKAVGGRALGTSTLKLRKPSIRSYRRS